MQSLLHDVQGAGRLVGRRAEIARIDQFLSAVAKGPQSLLLVGEAGIGKTRLWSYGVAQCRARGVRVLLARAAEDDTHIPGQGLVDLFGEASGSVAGGADPPLVERSRAALAIVRRLAADGPVVIAIDDLPWLDDLTRSVLRHVRRRLVDEPVGLFATARTGDGPLPLQDVDPWLELLEVRPLAAPELRRVVSAAVPELARDQVADVAQLAHGNALLALELARSPLGARSASAPGSLLAALSTRVAALPAPTVHIARLLAVCGPCSLPIIAAAAGISAGAALDAAVRDGLRAGVLEVSDDFTLRFGHPLMATAVLTQVDAVQRRDLHAVLAAVVRDRDHRAIHLARATVTPDPTIAAEIESAAERFGRRGAPCLAADLAGHSARLTPLPADSDATSSVSCADADRVRRTLARAMYLAAAGEHATALSVLSELQATLDPGPLRAEVVARRVILDPTDGEAILREALVDIPGRPEEEPVAARVRGMLGWLLALQCGRLDEGLEHAERALHTARAAGDHVLVAQAASTISTTRLLLGRPVPGLIEEAVVRGFEVVQSELVLWPQVLYGRQQLWDGHLGRARSNLAAMYDRAVAHGAESQRPYRLCDLGQVALAAGDVDAAARAVADGLEIAHDVGDERALVWLAYPHGLLAALRGDAATVAEDVERLDAWAELAGERPRRVMAAQVRASLAAARRDWSAAQAEAAHGQALLDAMGWLHPGAIPVLPLLVQAATLTGDIAALSDAVERMRRAAADLDSPWVYAQHTAAVGHLQFARDEPQAFGTLLAAQDRLVGLGYRLDAARTGCFAATAAQRAGHRTAAAEAAAKALAILVDCGATGWDTLARDVLDRGRRDRDDVLTGTELQIAALVADGKRNREIAKRLFLGESTVEAHLTRMYRKLGLRNRAELTRRAAELLA